MTALSKLAPALLGLVALAGAALFAPPAAAQTHLVLGSGYQNPSGVAVDATGNVFVVDQLHNAVKEILAPAYTTTVPIATLNGNFSLPLSIAIDANGNLFVDDFGTGSGVIKEITAASGYVTVTTLPGFFQASGIAVDSDDNLFLADGNVVELLQASGWAQQLQLVPVVNRITGVAVDASGNLFVANEVTGIQEFLRQSGYLTQVNLASGNANIVQPYGIALDAQGNVFFTDLTLGQVAEIPIAGGYSTVVPRLSGLSKPEGVTVDAKGNIFVTEAPNLVANDGKVVELVAATTTGLTSSLNPSTLGADVTFTATVTGSSGTPTGTVTFLDGPATLGTAALTAGVAALSTATLSPGGHSITAQYSGDTNFAPSVSVPLAQTVGTDFTVTTLTSSLNPSVVGQPVTFTASVLAVGGTVTFLDGSTPLTTVNLASGSASFTTSALTQGSHTIAASYSGDADFGASTSAPLSQSVNASVATVTAVTSSLNPSAPGQTVTFTAQVTGVSGTPTGAVAFMDGVSTLGTGSLNAGAASFTTAALTTGAHSITAVYAGAGAFSASTSAALTQNVMAAAPGGSTRTWVSSLGDDANLCARTAPCLTFRGALAKTSAGGEISVVDPGDYGNVLINQAVTISGDEVGTAGAVVSVANGIEIQAGAADTVILRGLQLDGGGAAGGSATGVLFTSGGALIIDHCSIINFQGPGGAGIDFEPTNAAKLMVADTLVSNDGSNLSANGVSGDIIIQPQAGGSVRAVIERVQVLGATGNGVRADGSVPGAGAITLGIRGSTIVGGSGSGLVAVSAGPAVTIAADGVTVSSNAGYGVRAVGAAAAVWLGDSIVTGNTVGLNSAGGGTLASFGDNSIAGNPAGNGAPTTTVAPR